VLGLRKLTVYPPLPVLALVVTGKVGLARSPRRRCARVGHRRPWPKRCVRLGSGRQVPSYA